MNWQPFQIPQDREAAIKSARWLRDRIAGIPELGRPTFPPAMRERVFTPKLESTLAEWNITEAEL